MNIHQIVFENREKKAKYLRDLANDDGNAEKLLNELRNKPFGIYIANPAMLLIDEISKYNQLVQKSDLTREQKEKCYIEG